MLLLHLSPWNFTYRLLMSQGCALVILDLKGHMSRSQCIDNQKMARLDQMIPANLTAFPLHFSSGYFTQRLPMSQGCALLIFWSMNRIWRNLTELNVLYQVFLAIRQHVLASEWLRHFSALDRRLKYTIVIMRCQDKSIRPFHIFDISETAERNLRKLYRKQEIIILYQCLCFSGKS